MKKYILIVMILSVFTVNLFAQNWLTNFDEAKKEAKAQNKNILMVFSGSDWCVPCMKLEKNIWQSAEFKTRGQKHFILLRVDFPQKKANQLSKEQQKHNESLAEKYNQPGYFPYLNVVDSDGNVLGSTGYKDVKPDEFIDMLILLEKKQ